MRISSYNENNFALQGYAAFERWMYNTRVFRDIGQRRVACVQSRAFPPQETMFSLFLRVRIRSVILLIMCRIYFRRNSYVNIFKLMRIFGPGWRLLNQFVRSIISRCFTNVKTLTSYLMNTTLVFDRCHNSSAVFQFIQQVICAKYKVSLAKKLTNGILLQPTAGFLLADADAS